MSEERKTILLADADERSRQLIELSLKKEGYRVITVSGTLDGLMQLHTVDFDVVVTDAVLDDGDGFELVAQSKTDPHTAHIPVVLVTANPEGDGERAKESGADDVISKPVRVKSIIEAVERLALEAMYSDEGSVEPDPESLPLPLEAVFTVEYRSFVAHLGDLPEEANAVIRLFDGKRTMGDVIDQADVDPKLTRELMPLLIAAEVLQPVDPAAPAVLAYTTGRPVETNDAPEAEEPAVEEEKPSDGYDPDEEEEVRRAEETAIFMAEEAARAAEEARVRADEARRRANEQRKKREELERRRTIAEINALDVETQRLQEVRQQELDEAREEADRLLREAESRAAALAADARRRATSFEEQEREIIERRRSLTQQLEAVGGTSSSPPEPSAAAESKVDTEVDTDTDADADFDY